MTIMQQLNEELIEQANKSAKLIANQKVIIFDYKNQNRELRASLDEMHADNYSYAKEVERIIEEIGNLTIKCSELENKLNNMIG
jgi:predicted RNase H-like nuclease (RuvC/YqgF family)